MRSSEATSHEGSTHALLPKDITLSPRESATIARLSELPGRTGAVVLLPDLSFKPVNPYPTGVAVAFEGHLVPTAIGSSINCGITLVTADATSGDIGRADWQRMLSAIDATVREYALDTPSLSSEELIAAMTAPERACANLGYSQAEVACVEPSGHRLCAELTAEQIRRAIPEFALRGTRLSMGQLGTGNHFVEFQKFTDIALPEMAAGLNLSEGSLSFAVHSSPPLGPLVSLMYGRRPELSGTTALKIAVRKALFHLGLPAGVSGLLRNAVGERSLAADEPMGRSYAVAYDAAAASGYVHRAMLVAHIKRIMHEQMGISCQVLADLSHNGIWRQEICGRQVYLHRHGACAFWPADHFPADHPYAKTGQPVFVGSSMSTPSALFVPGAQADRSHYSISHGTGRRRRGRSSHRPNGPSSPDISHPETHMQRAGVVALWSGPADIKNQLGYNYRPIQDLADVMEQAGVAKMVGKLIPVASYKAT